MTTDQSINTSNSYIEAEIKRRLEDIEKSASADVIVCFHPIVAPFDDVIRDFIEDIDKKKESLLVILQTDGGSIETTERIADVFRHHYKNGEVSFLIPNYAMSAGTILAMSGDNILMDYYSILGPIDPQVRNGSGQMVPALGYLEKYKELIDKSKKKGGLSQAELAFFIDKFDPAELDLFEQAREHSVDLLKRWLVDYKFKNWNQTETRKIKVTPKMKLDRAAAIANKLNNTRRWRSHGRGLSIDVIQKELGLIIEDFGGNAKYKDLNTKVRAHYKLLQDYLGRRGKSLVVQTRKGMFTV